MLLTLLMSLFQVGKNNNPITNSSTTHTQKISSFIQKKFRMLLNLDRDCYL